jgi:hypothetical protein
LQEQSAGTAAGWDVDASYPAALFDFLHHESSGLNMGKRANNFKNDSIKLISKIPAEWTFAILLGTLPILLFSRNSKGLDDMVSGLLAIGPLIYYFGWMLAPYALLFFIKYCVRFSSDRSRYSFNFIHNIITEVGTGFLTITRTGLGVAFGILLLPSEITAPTKDQYMLLYWMIFVLSFFNCAMALGKDELIQKTDRPTYRNPIKLNVRKTRD